MEEYGTCCIQDSTRHLVTQKKSEIRADIPEPSYYTLPLSFDVKYLNISAIVIGYQFALMPMLLSC
jgi:hypothetical protein